MTVKANIKAIVAGQPWLSASEIASCLARDPRNTRRDIAELKGSGELVSRKDERGTDRYCVAGSTRPISAKQLEFPRSTGSSSGVIDAEYTDVTDSRLAPPPVSYGGVVVHQGPGILAGKSRALVPSYDGASLPNMAGVLAKMFDFDPDGSLLEAAQTRQAVASAQDENERLRTALDHERRKRAVEQAEAKKKTEADELAASLHRFLNLAKGEDKEPSFAEQERRAREQRRLRGEEENELRYQAGLRRQERLAAEMWAEEDEPAVERMSAEVTPPLRTKAGLRRDPVAELFARKKPATPATSKWQRFTLAGIAVVAFVGVLKFAEGLAAV